MSWAAGKAVMELRVAMCQKSAGSKGIRCARSCFPSRLHSAARSKYLTRGPRRVRSDFWQKNYNTVKAANEKLPILLRESEGVAARLTATYGARRAPARAARDTCVLRVQRALLTSLRVRRALLTSLRVRRALLTSLRAMAARGKETSVDVEGASESTFGIKLQELLRANGPGMAS